MLDYNFVTLRLATGGGISTLTDVDDLAKAGVTHVIDCRAEWDDAILLSSHPLITYLWDGVFDDGLPKPDSWFQKGIEFALSALARPGAKIYAHCAAGVNRGPSMVYAILMAQGITAGRARDMIVTARPKVQLAYAKDAERAVKDLGYV